MRASKKWPVFESENSKKIQKLINCEKSRRTFHVFMLIFCLGILLWSFWHPNCMKSNWNDDSVAVFHGGSLYRAGVRSPITTVLRYRAPIIFVSSPVYTPNTPPPQYFSLELCSPHGFKHFKVIPGNFEHISDFKGTPT